MRISRFQIDMATGRFTLPVVILVCLLLWIISFKEWSDWASFLTIAATGYLMIEANTTYGLIRTRTTFQVAVYFYLSSIMFDWHTFEWSNLLPVLFMLAISQLFHSYESRIASSSIFHVFLFSSLGSIVFPQFILYVPLFLGSMIGFRAMNLKSLSAALLGLLTPYWFLFGYAFYVEQLPLFYEPLLESIHFYPINYTLIPLHQWITWGVVTALLAVSGGYYLKVAFKDKTRTRIYLTFIVTASAWTILFCILQPCHLPILLQIQTVCTAFLSAHLFSLTRNRFSGICFIVTFVALILLTLYNIWMRFFSF